MQSVTNDHYTPPSLSLEDPFKRINSSIVTTLILPLLTYEEVGNLSLVSRSWNKLCGQFLFNQVASFAVGPRDCTKVLGAPDEHPSLPKDIVQRMLSPCPFWEGKKVYQTHSLIFVPDRVSGSPICISSLVPSRSHVETCRFCCKKEQQGISKKQSLRGAAWILMTKKVLPGSKSKSRRELEEAATKVQGYAPPTIREAAVAIYLHNFCPGRKEVDMIYKLTHTYCRDEQDSGGENMWIVGGFSYEGVNVVQTGKAVGPGLRLSRSPGVSGVVRL